jgi:hypothetical protein
MFNRLQSRRANLQRFASLNPANYEPFSAGQFGATVAQHFSSVKVVGMKASKKLAILQIITEGKELSVQLDFSREEVRVRVFSGPKITFGNVGVDFTTELVYIDYNMFDDFASWIEEAIQEKLL